MRTFTCITMAVVLGLAAGCSGSSPFDDSCNTCAPQPQACAPAPAPCDPCAAPAPAPCDPCATPVVAQQQGQRPPDAAPGEVWCYVRVPAVTRQESEQVCIKPESCRQVQIPAVTRQVERRICTVPESTRQIPIPAQYEDQCEQVCVAPGRTEWARVNCDPKNLAPQEQVGECWTLKEVPPQYETRTKRVCVRPESCRTEVVPAQYETRMETVVVEPARVETIREPAQYETRVKEVVVCGPRWEWRRTTECEVPAVTNGAMAPAPAPMGNPPAANGFGSPDAAAPAPVELPPVDNALPPAGELPPLK